MIREPAVAGQFYDSDPVALRESVESYLRGGEPPVEAKAVLAPHAGYIYSGSVAGAVYSSVRLPESFIMLGPNHTGRGMPLALAPPGQWRTPLGLVEINSSLNEKLLQECRQMREDRIAHAFEHALEVQIPFLQRLVGSVKFAAICVGTAEYAALEALGHALARVVLSRSEPVLIVVSSDMNHYESAQVAQRKDRYAIERILEVDPPGLFRTVLEKDISMCGFAPAVAALTACRDLGPCSGRLIRYANSGEINGDYERVVGYAGMVIA